MNNLSWKRSNWSVIQERISPITVYENIVLNSNLCLESVKVRGWICMQHNFSTILRRAWRVALPQLRVLCEEVNTNSQPEIQIFWIPKRMAVDNWGDNKVSNVLKIFMHVGEHYELLPRDFCWICTYNWLRSPFALLYSIWMLFIVFGFGLTTEVSV